MYVLETSPGVTVVGHLVAVEAHVGRGLPSLTLTGLAGADVRMLERLAGMEDLGQERLDFLG